MTHHLKWLPALCVAIVIAAATHTQGATITWICSTQAEPWKAAPAPEFTPSEQPPEIRIVPGKTYQTMEGFGACFNELGWMALNKLPAAERDRAMQALFGQEGCAFNLGRLPIGASDFAQSAYSLDDTPGDYDLKDFSIERDRRQLLPYVKAAMAIRSDLRCWGSPWSPPTWMKTNNSYSRGMLKWEPAILRSYANYLAKWVEAYRAEGVNLYALTPQNEPNIESPYPTCGWTAAQLREFIADYLGPTLKERHANVELWLGLNGDPYNQGNNANDRLAAVLDDPKASAWLAGIAFQYDSQNQIATASALYPDKKLMQSETDCNRGDDSWADAQKLFGLMKRYISNGAGSYFAWNMVLDDSGLSTWNWKQNALITADLKTQKIRLNGEYYVMRHFSQYIKPGAKRALMTGPWGDMIGFVNPDGAAVLVIGNSSRQALPVRIARAGNKEESFAVTLPAASISTFVIASN